MNGGSSAAVRRQIARALLVRVAAANLIGAVLNSALPIGDPGAQAGFFEGRSLILFVSYMVFSISVLSWFGVRRVRDALAWMEREGGPTPPERRRLLGLPKLMAGISLAGWSGGALVFAARFALVGRPAIDVAVVAARNVLGAVTTAAICYLLVERMQRPVVAYAFSEGVHEPPVSIGVRGRLVVGWLLGSAVPLLIFGLTFLGRDAQARGSLAGYAWVFVLTGVFIGAAVTLRVGSSIVEPVTEVRLGLERIESGDLDVRLPVNDGTELGLLQDGFNKMVAGLRERRRLHELFGRHVGDEVAAHALASEASLGGRQHEASALFVDIIGSTTLAEARGPDEIASLLNDFFAEVVAAVRHEGGWVNKFEGDAALCVFGPPVGHDDHAARALRAAERLRRGLDRITRTHPYLQAAIGVASGTVFAGNVGALDRYEYTVIGDPVNQAARITELAKARPGRLLASSATVVAAGASGAGWGRADSAVLRGRSSPTELYEPVERAGVLASDADSREDELTDR